MIGKKEGYIQIALSIVSFVALMFWLFWLATTIVSTRSWPGFSGPYTGIGLLGIGTGLISWIWSVITSLEALRNAKKKEKNEGPASN
jgi:hypothetical protein